MVEVKLSGGELIDLMDDFLGDIVFQKRKWIGMEMPPLHRLFPHNVREMFALWYNLKINANITPMININELHRLFMKKMTSNKIKCKLIEYKSDYNRSYGSYKYKFSNLRLTRLGLYLYLNILPDIKNADSKYTYNSKMKKSAMNCVSK